MDEMRKQFEEWARTSFVVADLRHGPGNLQHIYQDPKFSYAWLAYQAGRAAGFAEAREAAVKVCKDSAGYDGGIRKALDEILALEPK